MKKLFFLLAVSTLANMSIEAVPTAWSMRPKRPKKMEASKKKEVLVDGMAFEPLPISLHYEHPAPGLIPTEELMNVPIEFMRTSDGGFARARDEELIVTLCLNELNQLPSTTPLYASALKAISETVGRYAYERGYIGYFFTADLDQLMKNKKGSHKAESFCPSGVSIEITNSFCGKVRTLASDPALNGPIVDGDRYAYIRHESPIKPSDGKFTKKSILRQDKLDDYAIYLNRYPDRKVDIHIHPLDDPSMMSVDYMITRNRAWHVYLGASNTGTRATGKWIESAGFIHTQAIATDATFRLDYSTADLGKFHSVKSSYDFSFFRLYRTRCKLDVAYNFFSSTQLGYANSDFRGRQYAVGANWTTNLHQNGRLFVDGFLEAKYRMIEVNNLVTNVNSHYVRFITPRLGCFVEKSTSSGHFHVDAGLNTNINGFLVGARAGMQNLGRPQVDTSWVYFDWGAEANIFLDALKEESNPPLAHELRFRTKGQWAFNFRLIPQLEGVLGGFYSVRGYPESFIAGDSAAAATIEYLYHFPRNFKPNPNPRVRIFHRPFKAAPRFVGDRPDWDLIFRTFLDVGKSHVNKKLGELDATLIGTGVGGELVVLDHLFIRADLGIAVRKAINANSTSSVNAEQIMPGHARLHISATLMY